MFLFFSTCLSKFLYKILLASVHFIITCPCKSFQNEITRWVSNFFCDFGRPLFPVSILVPDASIYVVWDLFFVFKFVYLFNYDFICYFFFISIYMIFFGFCLEKFFMHIFLREVLRQMISYDFSLFSSKCHKIIIIRRHKKWVINYRIGTFWLLDF